jgi:hypothetical protein
MPSRHKEEWRYSSTILDLSFIPWLYLLYPLGKSSQYPTGRMGGPMKKIKSFLCQETNPGHSPSQYQLS